MKKARLVIRLSVIALAVFGLAMLTGLSTGANAATPPENPKSDAVGLEGTVSSLPPSRGASISIPSAGQTFTNIPITVSGLCPSELLVKIFTNNVFVGSAECTNGSYSIKSDLFSGRNDIVARVYDSLDQAGPDSNVVSVIFRDAQFARFGARVALSSNYARRGANPGQELVWPLILSGGSGPYAISIDWGDGKAPDLRSEPFPGTINIKHVYDTAGVYNVMVKATDVNGTSAYLQLVGIGNGEAAQKVGGSSSVAQVTNAGRDKLPWWPISILVLFIVAAFWLGQKYELFAIRRRLEQSRREIQ